MMMQTFATEKRFLLWLPAFVMAAGIAVLPSLALGDDDDDAPKKIEVTATVSRPAIDPSESVIFTVSVESSDEVSVVPPKLPSLSDFSEEGNWQAQEMRASLQQTRNGPQFVTVRRTVFNWELAPKRLGSLTIFPVEVKVNGDSYRTKAVSVKVESGAGQRQQPRSRAVPQDDEDGSPGGGSEEDLFSQLLRRGMRQIPQGGSRTLPSNPKEAFFIQVETDKTEAYVGEQVTVSFFLYTTGLIRDLDTLKYPSLKGFWKEDIEIATHLNFTQEVVDGIPYKKALLASFALFPIKEGSATIDSYQAKCTVIPGADPFGALGMGRAYTFTKASTPIKIAVKPLPTEGRPADFSGAVGDFQVTARIEDRNVVANQPFPLKIRFEGRGNAKLIDIPPFSPPEGMELYDTQKEAKYFGWGTSFKEFTLQLIPRREGEFVIPPISASMFDPNTKRYVSRSTEELHVRVGQGSAAAGTASQSFAGGAGGDKATGKSKNRGPQEPTWLEDGRPRGLARWSMAQAVGGTAGYYSLILAALLALAARELGWGRGRKALGVLVKKRVRDLESFAGRGEARAVGTHGVNLLAFALGEIVGDRVSDREVSKLLNAIPPSMQKEHGAKLADVLQTFELLAFAPDSVLESDGQAWKDAKRLRELVHKAATTLEAVVAASGSDTRSSGP